jgi:AraC-like DNA-binding protein
MSSDEQQPSAAEQFAEQVLALAQRYAAEQAAEQRRTLSVDERLAEAGRIRAAWKAVEAELPALIAEAEATGGSLGLGLRVNNIADRLGVTESYVYRKLRERPTGNQ